MAHNANYTTLSTTKKARDIAKGLSDQYGYKIGYLIEKALVYYKHHLDGLLPDQPTKEAQHEPQQTAV